MKILFLDDNPNRTQKFRDRFPTCVSTETSDGCIKLLTDQDEGWDMVWLDHDLGGESFVNSVREDCGMEVVRWIIENKPKVRQFIVHTMNPNAGKRMVQLLQEADYEVIRLPFIQFDSIRVEFLE